MVFSVAVSAANGERPSGKASVFAGAKKICAVTVVGGVGSCSPKAKTLKAGLYSLTASFKKSAKYVASQSNVVSFSVGVPPETKILSAPNGRVPSGPAEVAFSSNEPLGSFECSLDEAPYAPCSSPARLSVGPGTHSFGVRAVSASGIPDPTPAIAHWESVGQAAALELCGEITHNEMLSKEAAAVYVVSCGLTIRPGATLTAGPGTVVKIEQSQYIDVEGTLIANGTSASPVTLTSWRDDAVGGDTNNDGNATVPATNDWGGIYTSSPGGGNPNPTISLDHLNYSYASSGLRAERATTSITNTAVNHVSGDGITVASPEGIPVVKFNTVTNAAQNAIYVYNASLDMGALTGNSGSSNGLNGVALGNDTVGVSSSLPWTGPLLPVLTAGCNSLTVPAKVTLTLGAGTIIKAESCTALNVAGSLVANGTSASPVILTSLRDDSVGGDTNGDGGATMPSPGDWTGVQLEGGGTASLEWTSIRYASIGLEATQKSFASIRGRFESDQRDVRACSWGQECAVDAAYSYWGSAGGPYAVPGDESVCGAVTATPYLTAPHGSSPANGPSPYSVSCAGESPTETLSSAQAASSQTLSRYQISCGEGFKEACEIIEKYEKCLGAATTLAQSESPFNFSNGAQSILSDGASWLGQSESAVVSGIGDVASFGLQLVGAAKTIIDIAQAYNSCI